METNSSNGPVEVGDLDPRFECPICLACLRDPVQTLCGHRFCRACIQDWLENHSKMCPVDAEPLQTKNIFPDNYTRREILGQRTVCRTCSREVSLTELDEHATLHETERNCPFRDIGCVVPVEEGNMSAHLDMQIHHHLRLLHQSCRDLKEDGRKRAISEEAEFWQPPSKGTPEHGDLLKALYERVVVLEQRAHEQEAHIQRLKNGVSALEAVKEELSLVHCGGEYLWRIPQFSGTLNGMKMRTTSPWLYSKGFYTSPAGYRFCARLNVSPESDEQLALVVHIMQSPHDAALHWPFSGRIQLAVVHPNDSELTVRETMISRPELDAFKRPKGEINRRAFGYMQFVPVHTVLRGGYLSNDTLLIKIIVQCV